MIKKFNEMANIRIDEGDVYVNLRNGQIVNRHLRIQYFGDGKPFMAYDPDRGMGFIFYEFAESYDDMIKMFVTNEAKKRRLQTIKEDYLNFLENKEVGTKVYAKDPNGGDSYVECVWDGNIFSCGKHMWFYFDDILNTPIWFQKPEGKNIVTDWTRKGYEWSDVLKSWVPVKK